MMGGKEVRARVREDRNNTIFFLKRRGFIEYERMVDLRLNVQEADIESYTSIEDKLIADGIEITSLKEEESNRLDCLKTLYE